nr:hypothetical protein L203_00287 [Cryptococcus depauperatus CBS 7841]
MSLAANPDNSRSIFPKDDGGSSYSASSLLSILTKVTTRSGNLVTLAYSLGGGQEGVVALVSFLAWFLFRRPGPLPEKSRPESFYYSRSTIEEPRPLTNSTGWE